jgi:hypothetical protein
MYDLLTLVVVFPLAVAGMTAVSWLLWVISDALGLN